MLSPGIEPVAFLPPNRPASTERMRKVPFVQIVKREQMKGFHPKNVELVTSLYHSASRSRGSEGPQAYPKYTGKLRETNFNRTRHLFHEARFMSTIGWETGLRSYDPDGKSEKKK